MTKSKGVFKKRSFRGNQHSRKLNLNVDLVESLARPSTSSEGTPTSKPNQSSSSSARKLTPNVANYDKYYIDDDKTTNIIVSTDILSSSIRSFVKCKNCNDTDTIFIEEDETKRNGLACKLVIKCSKCEVFTSFWTSTKPNPLKPFEINTRMAYGLRTIGKGVTAGRMLCGVLNLPEPVSEFGPLYKTILPAVKEVSDQSMKSAADEAIMENDGSTDLTVACDGSWQRRGHSSLNGVISISSIDTGKILDTEILTKFCFMCKTKKPHDCKKNFSGSSGGMEVAGVVEMFKRSVATRGARYLNYLGDGDSKGYDAVVESNPYGDDVQISKWECVAHVQKRLGTRLRKVKQEMKGVRLEDNKLLYGKGRLTKQEMDRLQSYYGEAIRRNKNNLTQMKQDVWAIYFHKMSTDADPHHGLCPKGENSWCKYNRAQVTGETYSHKHALPKPVLEAVKHVFRDLASPDLLRKCLHGLTQNPNESFNSVVWNRVPKTVFVGIETLSVGVYDAVISFNEGNIGKCEVLKKLGIRPGINMVTSMKKSDATRIKRGERAVTEASKKARQACRRKKLKAEDMEEVVDDPQYGAGMF